MIIADLMTKVTEGIPPDTPLADVVALMCNNRLSCALITNGRTPLGIITERDLVRVLDHSYEKNVLPALAVAEIMTPEPISMPQSASLEDALVLTRSRKLRHLLVTDDVNQLVGLVTQSDMVEAYVQLFEKHSELQSKNEELNLLCNEDALLAIGNRRAMEVELSFHQASASRHNKTYAVALIDVDYFKKFNDHYGHLAGDEALQSVANAIKATMRDSDKIYRYGGEEFLLLMPETELTNAKLASERIRAAVADMQFTHSESPLSYLTVSVGVASEHDELWQQLVERADKALYRAKDGGRNRIEAG